MENKNPFIIQGTADSDFEKQNQGINPTPSKSGVLDTFQNLQKENQYKQFPSQAQLQEVDRECGSYYTKHYSVNYFNIGILILIVILIIKAVYRKKIEVLNFLKEYAVYITIIILLIILLISILLPLQRINRIGKKLQKRFMSAYSTSLYGEKLEIWQRCRDNIIFH